MSTSRAQFLQRLRAAVPAAEPLPPVYTAPASEASGDTFRRTTEAVGGTVVTLPTRADLAGFLDTLAPAADRIVHPSLPATGRPEAPVRTPAELVVLPAVVGVAEDAAVLVTTLDGLLTEQARPRGAAFLATHMVLVLPLSAIEPHLHAAFARAEVQEALSSSGFAVWVSGPSKTADIEQTLVHGAHGPERLTVVLVEAE